MINCEEMNTEIQGITIDRSFSTPTESQVCLWDIRRGLAVPNWARKLKFVRFVSFSPSGGLLVSLHDYKNVHLIISSVSDGGTQEIVGDKLPATKAAFTPDGKIIVSAAGDRLILWDTARKMSKGVMISSREFINDFAISPDGKVILSVGTSGAYLWDIQTKKQVQKLSDNKTWYCAFSPDGRRVATAADRFIHLWNIATGRRYSFFKVGNSIVNCLAWSKDGRLLATGTDEGAVSLWNTLDGRLIQTLRGHHGAVRGLAFMRQPSLLASGGDDRIINLWNVDTGQIDNTLRGNSRAIYGIGISPDNKFLACALRSRIRAKNEE